MRFASAALGIMLAGLQVRQRIWNLWVSGQRRVAALHCARDRRWWDWLRVGHCL